MHAIIDCDATPMENAYIFLREICKKGDHQPTYIDRVHIHIGDNYIELEEGKALKMFEDSKSMIFEPSDQNDFLSLWKTALDADEDENALFFIVSTIVNEKILKMFHKYHKKMTFLDFSGIKLNISERLKSDVHLVEHGTSKKLAATIHKKITENYVTTVNFGTSFGVELAPCTVRKNVPYELTKIDIVGTSTYQPLETISVLTRSFLLPIDKCYDKKGSKVNNAVAYCVLKEIIGDKPVALLEKEDENDRSSDTSLEKSNEDIKKEIDDMKSETTAPVVPVKPRAPKKKFPNLVPNNENGYEGDGESGPITAENVKNEKTNLTKGGRKRRLQTLEPSNAKKGKDAKNGDLLSEVKNDKEAETKENEDGKASADGTPDPLFLVACATERYTGLRRPVILRLREFDKDDKTYYDEETLKAKLEEHAVKKLEEEKDKLQSAAAPEDDSPASPPMDCPASPDMVPVIPQTVKIIPTVPTIPLETQDVDMREPSAPKDVDYRSQDVDLRVAVPVGDVDLRAQDKVQDSLPVEVKKESCIVDDAVVPEEPPMEDLTTNQDQPVKLIPLEGQTELKAAEIKQEMSEETAADDNQSQENVFDYGKYIQIIVLDMTWEKFEKQIAIVNDDDIFEELTEREKTVVGPEPNHDYTKLTGWYSPEAMQFYVNKMVRALRKLQDRSALFEKEYQNMTRMVIYGQSPEMARQFAILIREESYGLERQAVPVADGAAQYFEQLSEQMLYQPRPRKAVSSRRHHYTQPHPHHQQMPHHQPHLHHAHHPVHPHRGPRASHSQHLQHGQYAHHTQRPRH